MMALPAFAAEYGEPDITPQTTMGEIRSNPSILGAGVWTYSKEQNLPGTEDWCNDQTLEKYVSSYVAQDCADGLNLLIRNYNAGVQITYKLYSEQEIAEDSCPQQCGVLLLPGQHAGCKVCAGALRQHPQPHGGVKGVHLHSLPAAPERLCGVRDRATAPTPDNDNNGPMEDIARA